MGGRGRQSSEFKASLAYRVSFRTARVIQKNPVSKNKKQKTNKKQIIIVKYKEGAQCTALMELSEALASIPSREEIGGRGSTFISGLYTHVH